MSIIGRLSSPLARIFGARHLHLTAPVSGDDIRDKRLGSRKKTDFVEGETGSFGVSHDSYELVDEGLLDRIVDSVKFRHIPIMHIICTRNNTKVLLANGLGKVLCSKSAGTEGYKNCRKGTTVAAEAVTKRVLTYATDNGYTSARLVFNGLGPGRNAAFKVIEMSEFKIVSLSDRTEADEPWKKRPRATKSI